MTVSHGASSLLTSVALAAITASTVTAQDATRGDRPRELHAPQTA
jgi:hypothetical protein